MQDLQVPMVLTVCYKGSDRFWLLHALLLLARSNMIAKESYYNQTAGTSCDDNYIQAPTLTSEVRPRAHPVASPGLC